ncbi:MAG: SipW-dependent-type signal peptide-containing protein [Clostridiales bacterium]|nr:SipW-dependent-type signal peptide-containing protein [Clostridiales bacterium]
MTNQNTDNSHKKKRLIAALAAATAVAMLAAGGTFAYFYDSSAPVINQFNTNSISVGLTESGNRQYEIIPGTYEDKDPYVTLNATVDSYLYVLVYGNNPTFTYTKSGSTVTDNIIDYDIRSDIWTFLLYNAKSDPALADNDIYSSEILENFNVDFSELITTEIAIYYLEATASDEAETYPVLVNDRVSYSAEITDVSEYKDGEIYLAFASFAIQQTPFANATDALCRKVITTSGELITALKNNDNVTLSTDISVSAADLNSAMGTGASIELNMQKLTITGSSAVELAGAELSLTNGTVEYTGSNTAAFSVESGSALTLDNVTLNVSSTAGGATSAINIEGCTSSAVLTIKDSVINSDEYFALSTNATVPSSSNVSVVIDNSTLSTSVCNGDPETAAVLFNVPGTLTVTNSEIIGGSQGLILRGGTADVSNSTIVALMSGYDGQDAAKFSTTTGYITTGNSWSDGNQLPAGALVVGNHSNSGYAYDTTLKLSNVTLTVSEGADTVAAIYAAACNGYNTVITGADKDDTIMYYVGASSGVSVNGTALTGTSAGMQTVGSATNG